MKDKISLAPLNIEGLKTGLITQAHATGFALCRISAPMLAPKTAARFEEWLANGHHADLSWMQDRKEQRAAPEILWPDVKSIIMLGVNYGAADAELLQGLEEKDQGVIALYAQRRDYHDVIKAQLKSLARWLIETTSQQPSPTQIKVFVDTAPVMEKPLAMQAGLGWQGKNTHLVSREFGSWLLLGAIYTTLELAPDEAEVDHCGSCRKCLSICPTNAFPAPYQLDARRCISYLTIEHKEMIPLEFRKAIGNRIFGCDDCIAICPWNKFAVEAEANKLSAATAFNQPDLAALLALDDPAFRSYFAGTPIKRTGHTRLMRNVLIAMGNSGNVGFLPLIREKLNDPAPLLRASAIWALAQLAPQEAAMVAPSALGREDVEMVRAEWARLSIAP